MSERTAIAEELRAHILDAPDTILEDPDVMRALIAANDRAVGPNIVDLRGVAMERFEARLIRLEDTHRSVIAAAYENLAGMSQVHRAILAFLEPLEFDDFLSCLETTVAEILRVVEVRLVLESHEAGGDIPEIGSNTLSIVVPGFTGDYAGQGREARQVTLRGANGNTRLIFGDRAEDIRSEALILLDFGEGRLPGMLAFGSADPGHFHANQGTDLLSFMGQVFERAMRRWLE